MTEDIVTNKQEMYEKVVEPALGEIGRICKTYGIDFMALCDFDDPTRIGALMVLGETPSAQLFLPLLAAQADGDIDSLIALLRETITSHNSIALHLLGFPGKESDQIDSVVMEQLRMVHFYAAKMGLTQAATHLFKSMTAMKDLDVEE